MKKTIKKILLLICTIAILGSTNNVFALSISDVKKQGDDWISGGSADAPITTDEALDKLLPIGQIMVSVASVILVICYMYLGIKYMMTDPSGKADIKQRLIFLVIATVLIYGGVGIFTVIVNLMNGILA